MDEILINRSDDGKRIEIELGKLIFINLPESPTTGFLWKLFEFDRKVVSLKDSSFAISPDSSIGGGGTRTYLFKTVQKGFTKIGLKLLRDWGPENILDLFEVTILVDNIK